MDQLHLPPDLYRDLRDRSNAGVSAWLCALAELGRWAKSNCRLARWKIFQAEAKCSVTHPNRIARKGTKPGRRASSTH